MRKTILALMLVISLAAVAAAEVTSNQRPLIDVEFSIPARVTNHYIYDSLNSSRQFTTQITTSPFISSAYYDLVTFRPILPLPNGTYTFRVDAQGIYGGNYSPIIIFTKEFTVNTSITANQCGNGLQEPGELCDGSDFGLLSCGSFGLGAGSLVCTNSCSVIDTSRCAGTPGDCSNGAINPGEECDGSSWGAITGCVGLDSYAGGSLSCYGNCSFDTARCWYCGNGRIEPGETCDGLSWGPVAGCSSLGFMGGNLKCSNCLFDTSNCTNNATPGHCGDSIIQPGETCEGTDFYNNTCAKFNSFSGGNLSCSNCQINTSGCTRVGSICGDDSIDPLMEQCDCGADWACSTSRLGGKSCSVLYGTNFTGILSCYPPTDPAHCSFNRTGCAIQIQQVCGNGMVNSGEQCDCGPSWSCTSAGLANTTCTSVPGKNFTGGILSCKHTCEFDTSQCTTTPVPCVGPSCMGCPNPPCPTNYTCDGDGVVDSGEACDGTNFNGKNCQTYGFSYGNLVCANCTVITTGCTNSSLNGTCGDIYVNASLEEECDSYNLTGKACADFNFTAGVLSCSKSCTFNTSLCYNIPGCQDSYVNSSSGELCDRMNLSGATCQGIGYLSGNLSCYNNCTFNTTQCIALSRCGDGIINGTEECDGANLGSNISTCSDIGYSGGNLSCMMTGDQPCHYNRIFCVLIDLTEPALGISNRSSFNITVMTDRTSKCRYSLSQMPYDNMYSFDYENRTKHRKFDFTIPDYDSHKFYVTCNYTYPAGLYSEIFDLQVDITPPVILSASADPSLVTEPPFSTTLVVRTDDSTVCKYDRNASASYNSMNFTFDGFNETRRDSYSTTNTADLSDLPDPSNLSYYVICRNRAGLLSAKARIDLTVNSRVQPAMTIILPVDHSYISNRTLLGVFTNRRALCYYGNSSSQSSFSGTFGTRTQNHLSDYLNLSSGSYQYYFKCTFEMPTGALDLFSSVNFIVDQSPPSTPAVYDLSPLGNQYTYLPDRLNASWTSFDNESGIANFYYQVVEALNRSIIADGMTSVNNTQVTGLNLTTGKRYFFRVSAVNYAGLWSANGSSPGLTVDPSLRPNSCGNNQTDAGESDTDCGGICSGCSIGKKCLYSSDCLSGLCSRGICSTSGCSNGYRDLNESDVDCGGACDHCSTSRNCTTSSDCKSGFCDSTTGKCAEEDKCSNAKFDPEYETDIDCGGVCADTKDKKCAVGDDCFTGIDCASASCVSGKCAAPKKDGDNDGVPDDLDKCPGTPAGEKVNKDGCSDKQVDSDVDGMPDYWETQNGLNPNNPNDAQEDPDKDGLTNLEEFKLGTDPKKEDTDGDGFSDGAEVTAGTDPLDPNSHPEKGPSTLFIILLLIVLGALAYVVYIQTRKKQPPKQQRAFPEAPLFKEMHPLQSPPPTGKPTDIMAKPPVEHIKAKQELRDKVFDVFSTEGTPLPEGSEEKKPLAEQPVLPPETVEEKKPTVEKIVQVKVVEPKPQKLPRKKTPRVNRADVYSQLRTITKENVEGSSSLRLLGLKDKLDSETFSELVGIAPSSKTGISSALAQLSQKKALTSALAATILKNLVAKQRLQQLDAIDIVKGLESKGTLSSKKSSEILKGIQ